MASVQRIGKRWRVQLYVNGVRESGSFRTKQEAAQWALQREAELSGRVAAPYTLREALHRYGRERVPVTEAAARWQRNKLANLLVDPLAAKPLAKLTRTDLAEWRDARERQVKPSTVNRELNLLSAVLRTCRDDWGWLKESPMTRLKRPKDPPSRKRRISQAEIDAIVSALGYFGGPPANTDQRTALAFLFALETAMRGGEIVSLQRADIRGAYVHLPKTKNGDARDIPLSTRAREILALVPHGFGLTNGQKDHAFRNARKRAGIADLHFHDARAEAIWRLSKKLDVLELARAIGHRNIASLLLYYRATPDELAAKLG